MKNKLSPRQKEVTLPTAATIAWSYTNNLGSTSLTKLAIPGKILKKETTYKNLDFCPPPQKHLALHQQRPMYTNIVQNCAENLRSMEDASMELSALSHIVNTNWWLRLTCISTTRPSYARSIWGLEPAHMEKGANSSTATKWITPHLNLQSQSKDKTPCNTRISWTTVSILAFKNTKRSKLCSIKRSKERCWMPRSTNQSFNIWMFTRVNQRDYHASKISQINLSLPQITTKYATLRNMRTSSTEAHKNQWNRT